MRLFRLDHLKRAVLAVGLAWGLAAAAAQAKCSVGLLAELPVAMHGPSPLVAARIDGREVAFVADSGAFFSTISQAAAAELKLRVSMLPPGLRVVGISGAADAYKTTVSAFSLASFTMRNVDFVIASVPSDGAVGLIGQNILAAGDVEYDFPHGAIRLFKPHDCGGLDLAYWAEKRPYSAIAIESLDDRNRQTIGHALLDGSRVRVHFDTGSGRTVVSRATALRLGVKLDSPDVKPAGVSFGIGSGMSRTWIAPFASFKIGDEEIRNVKLLVSDLYGDDDVILGADFFTSHRIYVANSQRRLYLTYEGGPVFDAQTKAMVRSDDGKTEAPAQSPAAQDPEPTDPDALGRRGALKLTRHDLEGAIADFGAALKAKPGDVHFLHQRALAQMEARRPRRAMADLDAALTAEPSYIPALLSRAALNLAERRKPASLEDLDAASRAASKEAEIRLDLGFLYLSAGRPDQAFPQFDQWVSAHPDDARTPAALRGRCRAHALLGTDLERAQRDCEISMKKTAADSAILETLGLVRLRRAQWQEAILDYAKSLALNPRNAWALYGRGLALAKIGRTAESRLDLEGAAALRPGIAEEARSFGLVLDEAQGGGTAPP